MDPRIILRGAIPTDSNIGGYGHRPLFGEVVSRGCFVLSFVFLPLCVAWSCGVVLPRNVRAKTSFSCVFLELTVLPRPATVLPCVESTVLPAQCDTTA